MKATTARLGAIITATTMVMTAAPVLAAASANAGPPTRAAFGLDVRTWRQVPMGPANDAAFCPTGAICKVRLNTKTDAAAGTVSLTIVSGGFSSPRDATRRARQAMVETSADFLNAGRAAPRWRNERINGALLRTAQYSLVTPSDVGPKTLRMRMLIVVKGQRVGTVLLSQYTPWVASQDRMKRAMAAYVSGRRQVPRLSGEVRGLTGFA